ncbi:MAG: hypothetical protein KC925_01285 [Candidatus Doudnabacteria bacterium]|nr:hypothetical protein [Candidatus Doudnabacteria bacterium]
MAAPLPPRRTAVAVQTETDTFAITSTMAVYQVALLGGLLYGMAFLMLNDLVG